MEIDRWPAVVAITGERELEELGSCVWREKETSLAIYRGR
jgi:hypothetical protein